MGKKAGKGRAEVRREEKGKEGEGCVMVLGEGRPCLPVSLYCAELAHCYHVVLIRCHLRLYLRKSSVQDRPQLLCSICCWPDSCKKNHFYRNFVNQTIVRVFYMLEMRPESVCQFDDDYKWCYVIGRSIVCLSVCLSFPLFSPCSISIALLWQNKDVSKLFSGSAPRPIYWCSTNPLF